MVQHVSTCSVTLTSCTTSIIQGIVAGEKGGTTRFNLQYYINKSRDKLQGIVTGEKGVTTHFNLQYYINKPRNKLQGIIDGEKGVTTRFNLQHCISKPRDKLQEIVAGITSLVNPHLFVVPVHFLSATPMVLCTGYL